MLSYVGSREDHIICSHSFASQARSQVLVLYKSNEDLSRVALVSITVGSYRGLSLNLELTTCLGMYALFPMRRASYTRHTA